LDKARVEEEDDLLSWTERLEVLMELGFCKTLMYFFHWNWMDDSCCCGFCSRSV